MTARRWAAATILAMGLALVASLLALLGLAYGASTGSVQSAILLRWMASTAALVLGMMWLVRLMRHEPRAFFMLVALAAYLLMPLSWLGRSGATQLIVTTWWVGLVVDLALWMAVAYAVVGFQVSRFPRRERPERIVGLR